jgi:glycosyltransferase involved in cell wall biosynthesis
MADKEKTLLVIGHVWPESKTTAAGRRMLQLLKGARSFFKEIIFVSPAQKSEFSDSLHSFVDYEISISLNDSNFDISLKDWNPNVVIYDRFLVEEQFGWRVQKNCPKAIQILDTEDLHSLRISREKAYKKSIEWTPNLWMQDDVFNREMAALSRVDYSLLISRFEIQLLKENIPFIPSESFLYLPFCEENSELKQGLPFSERKDIVTIGNLHHSPNIQSVEYIYNILWPKIHKALPNVHMKIYGPYAPERIKQLHKPEKNFHILGRAESVEEVFTNAKLCLAPLWFGAGIKGKLMEAMLYGLPSVTTPIGAESMVDFPNEWGGVISDDSEKIIESVINLYTQQDHWDEAQKLGFKNFKKQFQTEGQIQKLFTEILNNPHPKKTNFQKLLNFHSNKHYQYFSRWIEGKEKQ